tara:strand:+ start:1073 stop:1600 length:528 start_codon:yes stop_codon:yes gene_type:complete
MEDRRSKIADVALSLFIERGYHATSTRLIAQEAGVSEGLIFRHYTNKEGLLKDLLAEGGQQMIFEVAGFISEYDPKVFISSVIDFFFDISDELLGYWRLKAQLEWIITVWEPEEWERVLRDSVERVFKGMGYSKYELEAGLLLESLTGIRYGILRGSVEDVTELKALIKGKYKVI